MCSRPTASASATARAGRSRTARSSSSPGLGQVIPVHLSPQGVCFKGVANCIGNHGSGFTHAVYEPASRFWLFQGIETALFAGVALALIAFAGWWIHERVS